MNNKRCVQTVKLVSRFSSSPVFGGCLDPELWFSLKGYLNWLAELCRKSVSMKKPLGVSSESSQVLIIESRKLGWKYDKNKLTCKTSSSQLWVVPQMQQEISLFFHSSPGWNLWMQRCPKIQTNGEETVIHTMSISIILIHAESTLLHNPIELGCSWSKVQFSLGEDGRG